MTYADGKIGIGWNHTIKRSFYTRIGFGATLVPCFITGFLRLGFHKTLKKPVYNVDKSVDNIKIKRILTWISLK